MNKRKFGRHWFERDYIASSRHEANEVKERHKKKGRKVRIIERKIKVKGIWWKRTTMLYDVYVKR